MGSPDSPWIVDFDGLDMSIIFRFSPTPDMPAPQSSICRDNFAWTDIMWCESGAMRLFILGLLVGVENFVLLFLLRARVAISTLASGYPGHGVRRESGPATVGDSDCVDLEETE